MKSPHPKQYKRISGNTQSSAGFFTIPHFDGYAAVLIQVRRVAKRRLREAIVDAWLACAPAGLASSYLESERAR